MEIRPATSKADRKAFIRLPWSLYAWDPHWVPPLLLDIETTLDLKRNPFFEHAEIELFLAWEGRVPVGRIAAILDRAHNEHHGEKVAHFGFFECVDDAATARALVDRARTWGKARGMTALRGPVNPTTNETCGLLVEGFDSDPVLMMTYNPRYYAALLEKAGLAKAKDLYAWEHTHATLKIAKLEHAAQRLIERHGVEFHSPDMKKFDEEVAKIHRIYNRAWEKNWGFVPMTEAEFRHMAKNLKPVVDPDLLFIAEVRGEPAGFLLALPDLNSAIKHANGRLLPFGLLKILWHARKIDKLRLLTLGVVPEFRKRGIDGLLIYELFQRSKKKYRSAELSWVLEDNHVMNHTIESIGGRLYKRYRIYEGPIA